VSSANLPRIFISATTPDLREVRREVTELVVQHGCHPVVQEAFDGVARDLNNLALVLKATNRLTEAAPLMRRHIEIIFASAKSTGHKHPHLRISCGNYLHLLESMGRSDSEIISEFETLASKYGISLPEL
jgi:hypothetical protein